MGKNTPMEKASRESVAQVILKGTGSILQGAAIRGRQTLRETVGVVVVEKQSGRRHSGSRRANDTAFTVRRESQARKDVLVGQDREVRKDLRFRHSARKVTENVYSTMSNAKYLLAELVVGL